MSKAILYTVLLTSALLSVSVITSFDMFPQAYALKASGTFIQKYGSKTGICGDQLCKDIPGGAQAYFQEQLSATGDYSRDSTEEETKTHTWTTITKTETSSTDPGVGHESHQLVLILPPSENVYKGILTYDASEPIQIVVLHGPLAPGEDKGQKTWSKDGVTKYGLTFVEDVDSMGSYQFAGNALAVHTKNPDAFTVTYTVSYMENEPSETVMTGTLDSSTDPGVGHESHQLAVILPPTGATYTGLLTYTASEPIQIVVLHGPLAPGEDKGQKTWSKDGETKFGLTFVEDAGFSGSYPFAGNALAVHTKNPDQFTVTYTVVASQN